MKEEKTGSHELNIGFVKDLSKSYLKLIEFCLSNKEEEKNFDLFLLFLNYNKTFLEIHETCFDLIQGNVYFELEELMLKYHARIKSILTREHKLRPDKLIQTITPFIKDLDFRLYSLKNLNNKNGQFVNFGFNLYLEQLIFLNNSLVFYTPYFELKFLETEQQKLNQIKEIEPSSILEGIDLKTIKDKVRVVYELGIYEFLYDKYSIGDVKPISDIIAKLIDANKTTVYPYVKALHDRNEISQNYPKLTEAVIKFLSALNPTE